MRRKLQSKPKIPGDLRYDNENVTKLINYIMERGKKNTARAIVYGAFDMIKEKESVENPVEIYETALKNVGPVTEVRSRRVGGANYQVPREVRPERRLSLALRWIITAAKSSKGRPMYLKLADELILASKNEGEAVKRRENVHRMAESNKAFAHFSW